ncbi:MAG: exodeoxyribonuclease V subunit beta [Proteobacteria bacterium]|nr:exodeoxyribonuclease V subunit beta [Pseudomonadota bacterium]
MQRLDPISIPLSGRHLIEASAGTGKTYTITGIYLRLLLERELNPEQILVVTYTEAACRELRDKIRSRLAAALIAFESEHSDEAYLAELIARYRAEGRDLHRLRALLSLALINFDLAAVYTIHGFCLRVLQDSAFESGFPFEIEFIEDDRNLLQQVIDDFWRQSAPGWSPLFVAYLYRQGVSPDSLAGCLRRPLQAVQTRGESSLRFGPVRDSRSVDLGLVDRLQGVWQGHRDQITHVLLSSPALSRSEGNYPVAMLKEWFGDLDNFFINKSSIVHPLAALVKFSSSSLCQGTKPSKGGHTPKHHFFELAEQLLVELEEASRGVLMEFVAHCGPALAGVKARGGQVTFDDLLTAVRSGLQASVTGSELSHRILSQYPVALIDEFQDTDPVQYETFTTIFQGEGTLYMVGDPKQAIYGFRGADIFSYLQAAQTEADSSHTLVTNWRSEPAMIRACNSLFARHPAPFVLPGIDFREARVPESLRRRLVVAGMEAAMTIATFADEGKKGEAKIKVSAWVAGAVKNLLAQVWRGEAFFEEEVEGRWCKGRPLSAGDIAILVRSHREGQQVKDSLAALGLTAALSSRQSVFVTDEARELGSILEAVAACADERKVRRALSTRLLHGDAGELARLEENESAWEETLARFAAYRKLWFERGVAAMLGSLWAGEDVLPTLARQPSGERRLTNLRHLTELLQEAVASDSLEPEELLRWFGERRLCEHTAESALLRLESDEDLIKIVTVHKSKGLQYPVVFAPFFWDSSFANSKTPTLVECHDDHGALVVDLGSDAFVDHYFRQRREALAEELRLFYVAVTRAENRCILYWGRVKSRSRWVTASSPLQYLLSGAAGSGPDWIAALESAFDALSCEEALSLVGSLVDDACGAIGTIRAEILGADSVPGADQTAMLGQARLFDRVLNPYLGLRSFTSLHQAAGEPEFPDHDSLGPESVPSLGLDPFPIGTMFSFPRGAQAGSCLHAIMELYDFQEQDRSVLKALVEEKLTLFGFGLEWTDTVLVLLERMVETPLDLGGALRLKDISKRERLDELEFYYRLPAEPDHSLLNRIVDKEESTIGSSDRSAFMKGFIDLVFQWQGKFYILDYKSNYLGPTLACYDQARLELAMRQSGYDLQYRIYTEALHRYLGRRLPGYDYEHHFGGVFYLFLRGLDPGFGSQFGVYYARPSQPRSSLLVT